MLLSPEEVAPIIAVNPAVQANLRSQGRFPIPIRKVGKKIGISIYHLAEFIANGSVSVTEIPATSTSINPARVVKTTGRSRDWLRAFEMQVQYQRDLAIAIKYEQFQSSTKIKKDQKAKKNPWIKM